MIWLTCVIVYVLLPLPIFMLGDYISGYFQDRFKNRLPTTLHLLDNSGIEIIIIFLLWPIVLIFIMSIWCHALLGKIFYLNKFKKFLMNIEKKGQERRKKEKDLDYQAEKHLLGKR